MTLPRKNSVSHNESGNEDTETMKRSPLRYTNPHRTEPCKTRKGKLRRPRVSLGLLHTIEVGLQPFTDPLKCANAQHWKQNQRALEWVKEMRDYLSSDEARKAEAREAIRRKREQAKGTQHDS